MNRSPFLPYVRSSLLGIAILLGARAAHATPSFPTAIKNRLGATKAPECALCHVCGVTGRGTVNTPWGSAMRSRGLEAYNESSLATALTAMERDRVDSDGDGKIDVEAVKLGNDPNPPSCEPGADPTIPEFGCIGRVASRGVTPDAPAFFLLGLVVAGAVLRRRSRGALTGVLLLSLSSATLLACASGAHLAPRTEPFDTARAKRPPTMAPLVRSKLANELAAIGLDSRHLPAFEALTRRQVRGVMSTFTRSLGFACTDCHTSTDPHVRTDAMKVTVHMWNEMMRPYAFGDGAGLYCDSCHQGQAKFLDRHDEQTVAQYMSDNYTDQLKKIGVGKEKDTECESCHGNPADPQIIAKWLR